MGRSFKVPKCGIRSIGAFIAVDSYVTHLYFDELCCHQKDAIMKRCVLKDTQSLYGLSF